MKAQDYSQESSRAINREEKSSNNQQVERKPNKTGIPDRLKAVIEHFSGLSLDEVRVHYNSEKPAAVDAHAYTEGLNIYIAPGQEKHLAHEVWHVVQQMRKKLPATETKDGTKINKDPKMEEDAAQMGNLAEHTTVDTTENTTNLQQVNPQQEVVQRVKLTEVELAAAFEQRGGFFTAANSEVVEVWDNDWAESNCHGYTINETSGYALDPSELLDQVGGDSIAVFVRNGQIGHSGKYEDGTLTHLLIGIGILTTNLGADATAGYDARYNLPDDQDALEAEVIQPQIAARQRFELEGILDCANGNEVDTPDGMTIVNYDTLGDEAKDAYINEHREALNALITTLNTDHGSNYDAL